MSIHLRRVGALLILTLLFSPCAVVAEASAGLSNEALEVCSLDLLAETKYETTRGGKRVLRLWDVVPENCQEYQATPEVNAMRVLRPLGENRRWTLLTESRVQEIPGDVVWVDTHRREGVVSKFSFGEEISWQIVSHRGEVFRFGYSGCGTYLAGIQADVLLTDKSRFGEKHPVSSDLLQRTTQFGMFSSARSLRWRSTGGMAPCEPEVRLLSTGQGIIVSIQERPKAAGEVSGRSKTLLFVPEFEQGCPAWFEFSQVEGEISVTRIEPSVKRDASDLFSVALRATFGSECRNETENYPNNEPND